MPDPTRHPVLALGPRGFLRAVRIAWASGYRRGTLRYRLWERRHWRGVRAPEHRIEGTEGLWIDGDEWGGPTGPEESE